MRLCEVSLVSNGLSERPRFALRDLDKEPEQSPYPSGKSAAGIPGILIGVTASG